jgi:hypothetical protein
MAACADGTKKRRRLSVDDRRAHACRADGANALSVPATRHADGKGGTNAMSLLDSIVGAELVVVDEDHRLVYAWFGGRGVNVYDEDGNDVDAFTMGGTVTNIEPWLVRAAINRVRASKSEE